MYGPGAGLRVSPSTSQLGSYVRAGWGSVVGLVHDW
jgi:hypothetical protein